MKYLLETVVFVSGAVVMVFEIAGSRVIWPYFWTSIIVWTSIIWIILWSLSLWYHLGWKIADKKADFAWLSKILLLASVFLFLTYIIDSSLLVFLQSNIEDLKINAILSAILLFAPVSIFLWIVSPYAVKLKIKDLKNSAKSVWNLYALSTLGSIFWTFISGFFLIPLLWTNNILVLLMLILIVLSILLSYKSNTKIKILFLIIFLSCFYFNNQIKETQAANNFYDLDTMYNRVWIWNYKYWDDRIKKMWINNEWSSAMSLNWNGLVFAYTKYYDIVNYFNPNFEKSLMIWWAGYSYPKHYLKKYPNKSIDVVEIDPWLTKIARQHFGLEENERLNIIHEDGRSYLNKTNKKYDVIFWDAFKSHYSLPYQLTTFEAIENMNNMLNDNWVVIVNLIWAIEGRKGEFVRAEFATYKQIFPQVFLFKVRDEDEKNVQNLILVATKSNKQFDFKSEDKELQWFLNNLHKKEVSNDLPILTDDYAPVDYYISKTIK